MREFLPNGSQGLGESGGGKVRVTLGTGRAFVAQHAAHGVQVHAGIDHCGCRAVAQGVEHGVPRPTRRAAALYCLLSVQVMSHNAGVRTMPASLG